jgi:hypothetical protein
VESSYESAHQIVFSLSVQSIVEIGRRQSEEIEGIKCDKTSNALLIDLLSSLQPGIERSNCQLAKHLAFFQSFDENPSKVKQS